MRISAITSLSVIYLSLGCEPSGDSPTSQTLHSVSFADEVNGSAVGSNGVILSTSDAGKTWSELKPVTGKTLHSVSFADEVNGSAVGSNGAILFTSDGGKSWTD